MGITVMSGFTQEFPGLSIFTESQTLFNGRNQDSRWCNKSLNQVRWDPVYYCRRPMGRGTALMTGL